ncbi:proprotein convertase P-domain-containing protein [Fodinicola acaciae]|uniref:proprotein convertase P-domain-containing protein n=1 Tax=Fodinicola acaciae TaxID=2681555 RepID=UPI0013D3C6A5|nr:proprotein convertase P-domain-containing protein [Fodinicola acaciae]
MKRLRRAILICLSVVLIVVPAAARPAAADPAPPPCGPYLVVGVRGSGEGMDGWNGMAARVGAYAQAASILLPANTGYYSLPYPAAGINGDLPDFNWTNFVNSASNGGDDLYHLIRSRIAQCPQERIGLIGYSQGSMVIQLALSQLTATERNAVGSVLLLANPFSIGGSIYSTYVDLLTGQVVAPYGAGALLRLPVPADAQGRTTELCLYGDGICDAPAPLLDEPWESGSYPPISNLNQLVNILNNPIHGRYAETAGTLNLPNAFGAVFAAQLLKPVCQKANDSQLAIPDATAAGPGQPVSSTIDLPMCARAASSRTTVTVHVKHSFVGDLRIALHGPGGFSSVLKNPDESDGRVNLDVTYAVNASTIQAAGSWQLELTDVSRVDTGYLQSWSIAP